MYILYLLGDGVQLRKNLLVLHTMIIMCLINCSVVIIILYRASTARSGVQRGYLDAVKRGNLKKVTGTLHVQRSSAKYLTVGHFLIATF